MIPRIQTSYAKTGSRVIACMGDSLTFNANLGVPTEKLWAQVLADRLTSALGCTVKARNFGRSGDTTGILSYNMLYRFRRMVRHELPTIGIIWGGANDPGNTIATTAGSSAGTTATVTSASAHGLWVGATVVVADCTPAGYNGTYTVATVPSTTQITYTTSGSDLGVITGQGTIAPLSRVQTQNNIQAMVKWLKFGCIGQVGGQADLPAGGKQGDRYVVMVDTSSTGGAAAGTGQKTTLTGAGASAQTVWEFRNPQAGALGWGRIALATTAADKVSRIIVNGMHYLNWSANGDNYDTVNSAGTKYTLYDDVTGVRKAQKDAVTAEATNNAGVVYNDLYLFMGNRIWSSAVDVQGSFSWHYADSNQHLNQYGNDIVAASLMATIQAQSGWIAALTQT